MKALIPGSFDPITNGHLDIIRRAADMFEAVTVGVFINPDKTYLFSAQKRKDMIAQAVKDIKNVDVITCTGYVADYCRACGIGVIVKGVRDSADYEYEMNMAVYNCARNPEAQTVFLPAYGDMANISSSAVRKKFTDGEDISGLVPECVLKEFNKL